jgi:cellulose synthase/poly-beta-1,6-N-acetylglucosamine synthase-like glycosyltransferase
LPEWKIPAGYSPHTSISVIVPARNEEGRIEELLASLQQQSYPRGLFEIIIIDDFSEDKTAAAVASFSGSNIHLIRMEDHLPSADLSSKKQALATGISQARGELIITTDADCVVQKDWLLYMASFYENHSYRIFGAPVNFFREQNTLERFQSLDYLGMMALTGAGIHLNCFRMANGANLAYERSAFREVEGFREIDQLASGDDVLLMQKINRQFPGSVGYLKSRKATVFSHAQPDWPSFRAQRLRWASKASLYTDKALIPIQGFVFLFCAALLLSFLFLPLIGALPFLLLFVSKTGADYFFLSRTARFFHKRKLLKNYPIAQLLHIRYILETGFFSLFLKQFEWKGRKLR